MNSLWMICLLASMTLAEPTTFDVNRPLAAVSIESPLNLVILPVAVNGETKRFLLDSGFENSVIDADAAKLLRLSVSEPSQVAAPGGSVELATTRRVRFGIGKASYVAHTVSVLPLVGLSALAGMNIDGILGHDFFTRYVVEIDYANLAVRIYAPLTYKRGRGEVVPLFIRNNEPFLVAGLRQRARPDISALLKIDTGSADFIGFNGSFVQNTQLFAPAERKIPAPGVALGGETTNYLTRLDTFTLGSIRIARPVVGYSVDVERVGDAGTIGGAFLSRYRAVFDYSRHELILDAQAPATRVEDFVDMSGLVAVASESDYSGITVASVMEDSPAAKAGIVAGDIVEFINGVPAATVRVQGLRQLLATADRTVRLQIRRGAQIIHKTFTTARLI